MFFVLINRVDESSRIERIYKSYTVQYIHQSLNPYKNLCSCHSYKITKLLNGNGLKANTTKKSFCENANKLFHEISLLY